METETDDVLLEKCRKLIEDRLGWGNGEAWNTHDFESLSKKIQETTNVSLSIATLKRIWGKIRYESRPTLTTLNTLAKYIGHDDWRSFRNSQLGLNGNGHHPVVNGHTIDVESQKSTTRRRRWILAAAATVLVLTAVILMYTTGLLPSHNTYDPSLFTFSSKKVVDEGVPNTVVFDYDASAASPLDSVFIQQSWDRKLSRQVQQEGKQHTSIYYYPGFFEAKLVINGQAVREHNLLIKTSGWLPLVEQPGVPVYFEAADAMLEGNLALPLGRLQSSNIAMQPVAPFTDYYNVRVFEGATSDDLVFETEVKNDYGVGSGACQFIEIRLQFEGPAVLIPLSTPGCVGEISFAGVDGSSRDFSGFGRDVAKWVNVRCTLSKNIGELFFDGVSIIKFKLMGTASRLVGLGYRFQGTGSVNFVKVTNHAGEILFDDDFASDSQP